MMEEQAPNEVKPAEDRDDDAKDQAKDVASIRLLDHRANTNDDFNHPVDAGDEKKNDLHQAGQAIEPLHCYFLLYEYLL
jgi:hypothetical protein